MANNKLITGAGVQQKQARTKQKPNRKIHTRRCQNSYKVSKVPQYTDGDGWSLNTKKCQRKDNKGRGDEKTQIKPAKQLTKKCVLMQGQVWMHASQGNS